MAGPNGGAHVNSRRRNLRPNFEISARVLVLLSGGCLTGRHLVGSARRSAFPASVKYTISRKGHDIVFLQDRGYYQKLASEVSSSSKIVEVQRLFLGGSSSSIRFAKSPLKGFSHSDDGVT